MRLKLFPEPGIRPGMAFLILGCLACMAVRAQTVDFGKTYLNISKGLGGGTVETGDILEIRSSFVVRAGVYDSCSYTDVIPAGTSFINGSLAVLTNEGKPYKQFTDAPGDDCGWVNGLSVRINLGYSTVNPASATRRGRVAADHKPSLYGTSCIMVASFRVLVTASYNTDINLGGGTVTFRNGLNPIQIFTYPRNMVRVYPNYGTCTNTIGNNVIGAETNGSFGSGLSRNRGSSAKVPPGYNYQLLDVANPNDTAYAVVNNTSTLSNYSTTNNWPKPDFTAITHRVFNVWDIIGDHSGALSPAGNPPADTAAMANAGYMLVINASFRADSVFQHTVTGLCPNTYYTISCWMRNICSKCGCDSNGTGAIVTTDPAYIPTAAGDSSGVYPNISFDINGLDYYSTGSLRYTGQWVKKGFTYLTGPAQTSFTLKLFNNAPGGGGNDFALDDISITSCTPSMQYFPSSAPIVCFGNPLTLHDTVRTSFYNNYTYYLWQRSTDSGETWINVSSPTAPASSAWNGTSWEYTCSYTIPPNATQLSDSADLYRLVTASSLSNLLNSNCRFTDTSNILTLRVIDCGIPLSLPLLQFNGQLLNGMAVLNWSCSREDEPIIYEIERSMDGIHFIKVGTVYSYLKSFNEVNNYEFIEPAQPGTSYYRIRVSNNSGQFEYTRTIQLSRDQLLFSFVTVINPFSRHLQFDIASPINERVQALLIDPAGRLIRRKNLDLLQGINRYTIDNTYSLADGIYFLVIESGQGRIQRTVLKQH